MVVAVGAEIAIYVEVDTEWGSVELEKGTAVEHFRAGSSSIFGDV